MIDLSKCTDAEARSYINERKPLRYMTIEGNNSKRCDAEEDGSFETPCRLELIRMPDGSVRQMMLRMPSYRN